ncbi:MAG: three-Cys-motif partner protein TcmP [bacterium]|nr:three-Cys-motif partner protein TcmP [bacterium]
MSNKNFFNGQSDGTAVKIKFYENYIEGYLVKILMKFGSCIVADLFCGPGKNGDKDGSPLILIKKAKEILENKILLARYPSPRIYIIFNDYDKENIEKLNIELSKINYPPNIKIIKPQSNKFSEIASVILKLNNSMPKFFFLDPFTYSDISLSEIKQLMTMPYSEIMMFLPTFLIYRFITSKKNPLKLINFLNNFTSKGLYCYLSILDLSSSIILKMRSELRLKFVQHVLIDIGKNKNSLFLITKNIKAAMLFNNIFWKETYNGKTLKVSEINYHKKNPSLFSKSVLPTNEYKNCIIDFQYKMVNKLIEKKEMLNTEIIEFAVMEGYKPKCANDVLTKLKKEDKIKSIYLDRLKTRGFYVSEDKYNQKLCKVVYL